MGAREARFVAVGIAMLLGSGLPTWAHGPPPEILYDPLTHTLSFWMTTSGGLALEAPAEGFTAFPPASPGGVSPPLAWAFPLPLASSLGGIAARIVFRSDGAVIPRPTDRALLQVEELLNGDAVNGTTAVVSAPEAAMQPNQAYPLDIHTGSAAISAKAGDAVGLRVTFLGTAPSGSPGVLLGPDGSRASSTFRVSGIDLLYASPPGWKHVRWDDFDSQSFTLEPTLDVELHHGDPDQVTQAAKVGTDITLRILNPETPQQGSTHGSWGTDAPHMVLVRGQGLDEIVPLHPSEVLMRQVHLGEPGTLELACQANCNATGTFARLQVLAVNSTAGNSSVAAQEGTTSIDPGKFYEVNVQLQQDESIDWSFSTRPAANISYDIHSHIRSAVQTYLTGNQAAANGTFRAPSAATYSLLLQNANPDPATVAYAVRGGTPYVAPKPTPVETGPLLPAMLAAAALLARRNPD